MVARKDYSHLVGGTYGAWTVIEVFRRKPYVLAKCICSCGTERDVRANTLENKKSTDCGCLKPGRLSKANTKHGNTSHDLWDIFYQMNSRCSSSSHKYYYCYGGRGIEVCSRWDISSSAGFSNFVEDMGELPDGLTLDRINNDGNYCPENCRWASRKQQANNTRIVRLVTYRGRTLSLSDWAQVLGIHVTTILHRLDNMKLDVEDAFAWEKHAKKKGILDGTA